MGILDRLKPQPRWKHSDPAVRLQAIPDLGDAVELAVLAEHDPDGRVRTAALSRIADTAVLARVTNSDPDRDVRDFAADRLLALALDASNSEAATAAGLLTDVRRVSTIAKSSAADDVRGVALAALTDERALGGVARHAKMESTALAALGRLSAADELLATALNSEHRDVSLAAFDRVVAGDPTLVTDVARLKSIEARAQDKVVARRAKTMLQAIEDAESARRAAEEEREKQEAALCAAVERLATAMDPDRIAADLARLRAEWNTLARTDPAAARRFDAGADAAGTRITQRRSEIAAALEEARRREEVLGRREALCRRIEMLRDGDVVELEQLGSMEAQWAELPPFVGYEREVEQLAARFAASAKACRQRIAQEAALREARSTLEELVAEAESLLVEETDDVADRWRALTREARELAATLSEGSQPASDLLERLAVLSQAREARETAAREASAKAAADRVAKLTQLVSRARRTAESSTVTLREGERLLLDITNAFERASESPTTRETEKNLADLRTLQDRIKNRVKELRDLDTWRRFANGEQQERLIAMAEAIVASLKVEEEAGTASDLAATANALRELQAEWKKVADGPQQSVRQSWDRFRLAVEFIRSRCEVHFAQIREERSRNLATRAALVAQAEELADSTEWSRTAAQFQEMQKAWAECGPVSDASARGLALRFRAACNTFFTHRREALSSRKQEWNENLARKEALCERAEQLSDSTDWDTTADELKKLQAEWKTIGPTRRDKSEEIWTRFRSSADKFFERYSSRHKIAAAAQLAESEALVVALESIAALAEAPSDLAEQVQTLRTTISNLPQPGGTAATALHERWMTALAVLVSRWPEAFRGTDLDPVANRERKEKLLAKVEALVGDEAPVAAANKTTTELLAERLRSALESNALGVRPDETKWRAAGRAVEKAQDAWSRILQLPGDDTDGLEDRFRTACKQVLDQVKKYVAPPKDDFAGGGAKGRPGRTKQRGGRD